LYDGHLLAVDAVSLTDVWAGGVRAFAHYAVNPSLPRTFYLPVLWGGAP
jgi:hypothetical protein